MLKTAFFLRQMFFPTAIFREDGRVRVMPGALRDQLEVSFLTSSGSRWLMLSSSASDFLSRLSCKTGQLHKKWESEQPEGKNNRHPFPLKLHSPCSLKGANLKGTGELPRHFPPGTWVALNFYLFWRKSVTQFSCTKMYLWSTHTHESLMSAPN